MVVKRIVALFLLGITFLSNLIFAQGNFWIKTNAPERWTSSLAFDSKGNLYACSNDIVVSRILKSTDKGQTWEQTSLSQTLGVFNNIVIDSQDNLYAATSSKISRSRNGGNSWEAVNTGLPSSYGINQLTIHMDKLFVASTRGIFMSSNFGDTWNQLNDGNNGLPSTDNIKGIGFGKNGEIFLSAYSSLSFYISVNNGITWSKKSSYYSSIIESNSKNQLYLDNNSYSEGVITSSNLGATFAKSLNIYQKVLDIYIAPNDDIYVGIKEGEKVYRSTTNGASWQIIATGIFALEANNFAIDKEGFLFLATNAGVYRSNNPIISISTIGSPTLFSPNNNSGSISLTPTLSWTSVNGAISYHLQVSTNSNFSTTVLSQSGITSTSKLISSLLNNTTYYWRVNATDGNVISSWSDTWSFTTQSISSLWQSTNWPSQNLGIQAIATNKLNHIFVCTANDGIYRSSDLGNTWVKLSNGLSFNYISSISIDEFDRIFIGTHGDGVYFSNNNGNSWSKIGLGTIRVNKIFALNNYVFAGDGFNCTGVYRTSNLGSSWYNVKNGLGVCTGNVIITKDGLVFGGSGIEGMYKSTNYGNSWQQINNGLTSTNIATMVADNFGNIFVGTQTNIYTGMQGKGIFKSNNNGTSWQNLTSGITTNEIAQLALSYNGVVVTSGAGNQAIFKSTNSGNTWIQFNQGLPNPAGVGPIGITKSGYIFAAVNDKIYKYFDQATDIKSENEIVFEISLAQNYPNPFNPTTMIKYSIANSQFVTIKVYDILGNEIANLVNEEKPPGNHKVKFDGSNLPSGVYFYRLQAGSFSQTKKLLSLK